MLTNIIEIIGLIVVTAGVVITILCIINIFKIIKNMPDDQMRRY